MISKRKKNFIWIASFPKSGNTWVRAFISSLLGLGTIGEDGRFAGLTRTCNDEDLRNSLYAPDEPPPADESMAWRQDYQQRLSDKAEGKRVFCKTHARYGTIAGNALINKDVTFAAIVIVRNPIDVAASMANHLTFSNAEGIRRMSNPYLIFGNEAKNGSKLYVPVGSWDINVVSWLSQTDFPVLMVRYEDLYFAGEEHFGRIANDVLNVFDEERIKAAIEEADFSKLKEKESKYGFAEGNSATNPFFNKGRPYHALEAYSSAEKQIIWKRHGLIAEALGYRFDGESITLTTPNFPQLHAYAKHYEKILHAPALQIPKHLLD